MNNNITNETLVNTQKEKFYLDPHFVTKAKNKSDLVYCFSKNGKTISFHDLNVDKSWFAKLKKGSSLQFNCQKSVPVEKQVLQVLRLRSWPLIVILLKIVLNKQLSIGKVKQLYEQITSQKLPQRVLLRMLAEQNVLCVQVTDRLLQIVYNQETGLVDSFGNKWKPAVDLQASENLAKAREKAALVHREKLTPTKLFKQLDIPKSKEEYEFCLQQINNAPLTTEEKRKTYLLLKKELNKHFALQPKVNVQKATTGE